MTLHEYALGFKYSHRQTFETTVEQSARLGLHDRQGSCVDSVQDWRFGFATFEPGSAQVISFGQVSITPCKAFSFLQSYFEGETSL